MKRNIVSFLCVVVLVSIVYGRFAYPIVLEKQEEQREKTQVIVNITQHDIGDIIYKSEKEKQILKYSMEWQERKNEEIEKEWKEYQRQEKQEMMMESQRREEAIKKEQEKEILTMAAMMYAEQEEYLTKLPIEEAELVYKYTASVIVNRRDKHYMGAESISDVLYSKGQYHSNTIRKVEEGREIPPIVVQWAKEIYLQGNIGADNLLMQGEAKMEGREPYVHIGNQYFYTLSEGEYSTRK